MKKGSFKDIVNNLGLEYKKEVLKIIFAVLLVIGIPILSYFYIFKTFVTSLIVFVFMTVLFYAFIDSYHNKEKALQVKYNEEFISLMTYFESYIACDTNVYQAFLHSIQYCSNYLQEKLQKFLNQIDHDKSVKPFTDFAENFTIGIANNIMISIYQMVDQGENTNQFTQFSILFEQMSRIHNEELKAKKVRQLDNVTFYPLVGTALLIAALSTSIISMAGEMVNVI